VNSAKGGKNKEKIAEVDDDGRGIPGMAEV
jgi:hypothetical protein